MIKLRPYQRESLTILQKNGYIGLLADEMGLGKTATFLAALHDLKDSKALVVCPASVKLHWKREAWRHYKIRSTILSGLKIKNRQRVRDARLVIVNYDILKRWWKFLSFVGFDILGIDECHLLGNPDSLRTRAVKTIASKVERIVGISGTAVTNNVMELFPVLNMLWPEDFDSPYSFGMTYCTAEKSFGKTLFKGIRNGKLLHAKLLKLGMARHTKAEVIKDLPPLIRTVLPVDLPDKARKEYNSAENDLIGWLRVNYPHAARAAARNERRVRFCYLKQLAVKLKMPSILEWIGNFLEESDGKLLIGVWHRSTTAAILEKYDNLAVVIDGSKTAKQRQQAEDAFQTSKKCRLLLGQLKAAGLGLNLTAAESVLTVEIGWTSAVHQQFEARPHRLTSTHKVHSVYLVAAETIEDKLLKIVQKKSKIADMVLDGVSSRAGSLNVYDQLQLAMLKDPK